MIIRSNQFRQVDAFFNYVVGIRGFDMQATIENGELVIRIPVETPPRPSSSGKTLIVATSGGNKATTAVVNGQPVVIGLNAYIKK